MRLVPHDQDTGGFFVALLRKREVPVKMPEFMEDEPEEVRCLGTGRRSFFRGVGLCLASAEV